MLMPYGTADVTADPVNLPGQRARWHDSTFFQPSPTKPGETHRPQTSGTCAYRFTALSSHHLHALGTKPTQKSIQVNKV